ncbi:hypothetical protein GCM10017752_00970 [Streptomyces roseoviridis]
MPSTAHKAMTRQGLRVEYAVRARITESLRNGYEGRPRAAREAGRRAAPGGSRYASSTSAPYGPGFGAEDEKPPGSTALAPPRPRTLLLVAPGPWSRRRTPGRAGTMGGAQDEPQGRREGRGRVAPPPTAAEETHGSRRTATHERAA